MSLDLSTLSSFNLSSFSNGPNMEVESELSEDLEDGSVDQSCTATITSISVRRVRIVVSLVGKLVLPAVVGVYYAYLRNQKNVLESVKQQVVPAIVAFLTNSIAGSLSSVQEVVTYPTIDPLLQIIKLRYRPRPKTPYEPPSPQQPEEPPEKSVQISILSEPNDGEPIRADVVFVHGLNGSVLRTWRQGDWQLRPKHSDLQRRASSTTLKQKAGETVRRSKSVGTMDLAEVDEIARCDFQAELTGNCWPRDWLPKDCPGIRVIALEYTTDPYLWRPVWVKKPKRTSLEERSKEMMEKLLELGVGKNPIIWVGHSKGGLFVKQMLVNSWESPLNESPQPKLHLQTKAIMFYSVPHKGSSLASFSLPFISRSVELLEIRKDCSKVLDLHKRFLSIYDNEKFKPEIFSFIETSLTFMTIVYLRIVAVDSADPGVGEKCWVPLDHRQICKPRSRNCFLYQELVDLIHKVS